MFDTNFPNICRPVSACLLRLSRYSGLVGVSPTTSSGAEGPGLGFGSSTVDGTFVDDAA
jgi:hypothetical protein